MKKQNKPTSETEPQVRKFNPGLLQTDEELATQFVVRQNELQTISEVVRNNIGTRSCQHALVVGSRGQGKTMLLRRLASEIRTDRELSKHFLPVRFMEENQEIDSLADFWMETLFQFIGEMSQTNGALSKELATTHQSLSSRWREQGFEDLARSAVLEATDRIERRLVLLVENAQSLFSDTGDNFGWGLRKVLQSTPQITLIASATSRFGQLDDPRSPFFELFRIVALKPLSTKECNRLWSRVSGTETNTWEIRPLEILTGGNPRLIVFVATFARHRSLRQLMEELVVLIDEHTDYFRSHLDVLPKQERRVFIALIDLWKASSTSEIAKRARLDMRVVSTMVGRLIERGAVTVISEEDSRKRLYVASERLYSIYYKLRRENNEASVVESLIHFMVVFYDLNAIRGMSKQLFADALESHAIQSGIESALANKALPSNSDLRLKWDEVAKTSEKVNDQKLLAKRLRLADEIDEKYREKRWEKVLKLTALYIEQGFLKYGSRDDRELDWAFITQVRSDAYLALEQFERVIDIGEIAEKRLSSDSSKSMLESLYQMKLNEVWAHLSLDEHSRVAHECEKVIHHFSDLDESHIPAQVLLAYILQADAQENLGDPSSSVVLLDEALTIYRNSEGDRLQVEEDPLNVTVATARYRLCRLLHRTGAESERAMECLNEFLTLYDDADNEVIRGYLISAQRMLAIQYGMLGDFGQEIALFESVIDGAKDNDEPYLQACAFISLLQRGRRLAELDKPSEALISCDDAERWIEKNPDLPNEMVRQGLIWYANCTRALAHMRLGDEETAIREFRSAYTEFDIDRRSDLEEIMRLISELVAAEANEEELIRVVRSNEDTAWDLLPLIVVLQRRVGLPVEAPPEAIEVADDLESCINERLEHGVQPGYFLRLSYD
ncbi:MAG: ATP-binding protein [Gammaproteobacteria bacterium]|nr:ATP-binding protein [Gammaproteobacteria bacterium]